MIGKLYKLVVHVPLTHADAVRKALGDAGAGRVAKYGHCSFSVRGIGRFIPLEGANPHIGEVGKPEEVEEEAIHFSEIEEADLPAIMAALRAVHPYEEIAFEVTEMVRMR